MRCGYKIYHAAIGSPQPPPGGGLLLCVACPSARLRACPKADSMLLGIGGPQYAENAVSAFGVQCGIGPPGPSGPQPPPGGGPLLFRVRAFRRLQPEWIILNLEF